MRVIFTRFARQELEDAVRYYELEFMQLAGLCNWQVYRARAQIQGGGEKGRATNCYVSQSVVHRA